MKKIVLFSILCFLFFSCISTGDENIVEGNTWKLIETRVSIGGAAEFTPTKDYEIIQFLPNNRVWKSNGWCGEEEAGTINYENNTFQTNCEQSDKLLFEIEGDIMIVRNPSCIEACDYKYQREETNVYLDKEDN
ncbi:hypothetical protein BH23BAC2_BH23BAC2_27460 [soil metagenome]